MVQQTSLGYRMKKDVVADDFATWSVLWGEAIRLQERHSWIRGIAETKSTDPEAAIREIIPILAFLNPSICAAVKGSCELAVEVLRECRCGAHGDPVSPPRDTPRNIGVEGGRMQNMGSQDEQVAALEAELRAVRAERDAAYDELADKNQRLQAISVITGPQPDARHDS